MSNPTSRTALLTSAAQASPDAGAPAQYAVPFAATPSGRKAARRARRAELRATAPDPLLMAEEAAAETGRALSTFWRDVKRGILPAPFYVTPRAPRWRQSELRAAVEATRGGKRAADLQSAA